MAIHPLNADSEFTTWISSHPLVLVDFYADWCEPCKVLDDILIRLNSKCDFPLEIVKVDVEAFIDLRKQYHVLSVPVLALFRSGELVWRMNGFQMEDELLEIITKFSRETSV